MLGDCVPDWLGQPCELGYCVRERERERERQESNHDQQILIERLQSGNNWDNCSTLEEGRTNRTRDGLKDTVLGQFQTQSEMQNKSEESNRRRGSSERNGVARLFQRILASKLSALLVTPRHHRLFVSRFSRSISKPTFAANRPFGRRCEASLRQDLRDHTSGFNAG